MNRRSFFRAGTASLVSSMLSSGQTAAAPVLATWSNEDHRRRLESIQFCTFRIRRCLRKHLVTNYIPGHAVYNLARESWEFTEKDEEALDKLKAAEVGLIQPWSAWGTAWRGTVIRARNPAGFRRFVDAVHRLGMKIIPYTSSFYFERDAPELRSEWAWPPTYDLRKRWAHCSPASPGWRAFTLPRLLRVMDEYGVDGLYDDLGYVRIGERPNYYGPQPRAMARDDVIAFEEGPRRDGALEDWLGLLYSEVKRRGGIYKLHKEGADRPYTDFRVYDYLWVGEETRDPDWMRETVKSFEPYVTPQPLVRLGPETEAESFLHAIPYLQFPILGRGEGGQFPEDFQRLFARWLKFYRKMVGEGTSVWMEITDSDLFLEPLPRGVVASAFANRELYLVLANYRRVPVELETADLYFSELTAEGPRSRWTLAPRSLEILRRPTGGG